MRCGPKVACSTRRLSVNGWARGGNQADALTRVLFASLLFVLWPPGRLVLAQGEVAWGSVMQAVLARGELICGANAQLVGFGIATWVCRPSAWSAA